MNDGEKYYCLDSADRFAVDFTMLRVVRFKSHWILRLKILLASRGDDDHLRENDLQIKVREIFFLLFTVWLEARKYFDFPMIIAIISLSLYSRLIFLLLFIFCDFCRWLRNNSELIFELSKGHWNRGDGRDFSSPDIRSIAPPNARSNWNFPDVLKFHFATWEALEGETWREARKTENLLWNSKYFSLKSRLDSSSHRYKEKYEKSLFLFFPRSYAWINIKKQFIGEQKKNKMLSDVSSMNCSASNESKHENNSKMFFTKLPPNFDTLINKRRFCTTSFSTGIQFVLVWIMKWSAARCSREQRHLNYKLCRTPPQFSIFHYFFDINRSERRKFFN